jgi:hypothetical protein
MATSRTRSALKSVGRKRPEAVRPSRLAVSLADLITVMQDVVGPGDDGLVVATVRHLLRAGRLTKRGTETLWRSSRLPLVGRRPFLSTSTA